MVYKVKLKLVSASFCNCFHSNIDFGLLIVFDMSYPPLVKFIIIYFCGVSEFCFRIWFYNFRHIIGFVSNSDTVQFYLIIDLQYGYFFWLIIFDFNCSYQFSRFFVDFSPAEFT